MSLCAMVTVPAPLPSSVTVTLLNVESSVRVFTNEPLLIEILDGLSGWFVEPQIVRVTTSSANAALVARHMLDPKRTFRNGLQRFIFPPVRPVLWQGTIALSIGAARKLLDGAEPDL